MKPPSEPMDGSFAWRLIQLEKRMENMERLLNRLVFAVLAATLTLAASAITFALVSLSASGGPP